MQQLRPIPLLVVLFGSYLFHGCARTTIATDGLSGDYLALQGTWTVTHNEIARTVTTARHGRQFIFTGDQFHIDGDTGTERFVLDEAASPKQIDFISGSSVIKGIYKLQDGVLTLCTAPPGVDRPTRFETSRESRVILTIVERTQ